MQNSRKQLMTTADHPKIKLVRALEKDLGYRSAIYC